MIIGGEQLRNQLNKDRCEVLCQKIHSLVDRMQYSISPRIKFFKKPTTKLISLSYNFNGEITLKIVCAKNLGGIYLRF